MIYLHKYIEINSGIKLSDGLISQENNWICYFRLAAIADIALTMAVSNSGGGAGVL